MLVLAATVPGAAKRPGILPFIIQFDYINKLNKFVQWSVSSKYKQITRLVLPILGEGSQGTFVNFIYRRPTLYPLEIAVDFLKSL